MTYKESRIGADRNAITGQSGKALGGVNAVDAGVDLDGVARLR